MLSFYLLTAILGGTLVVFSAIAGADDGADTDHDTDASGDQDGETSDAGAWVAIFSLRFWTYTLGALGSTGALLTWLTDLPSGLTFAASSLTGLFAGFSISTAMRLLKRTQNSSLPDRRSLLGSAARVLVTVRPHEIGKIRLDVGGEILDLLAVTDSERALEPGTQVVVVALEGDKARVVDHA